VVAVPVHARGRDHDGPARRETRGARGRGACGRRAWRASASRGVEGIRATSRRRSSP
jgi:hypothetical protein